MTVLTITLSRTLLPGDLDPLVLSGVDDENPIGITAFTEPARIARVRYAPPSDYVEGDISVAASYQQSRLPFTVCTDQAADEFESRALLEELKAALGQFRFTATTVVNDAPAQVWTCDTASISPAGPRSIYDLQNYDPVWNVDIPCRPTPGG